MADILNEAINGNFGDEKWTIYNKTCSASNLSNIQLDIRLSKQILELRSPSYLPTYKTNEFGMVVNHPPLNSILMISTG